jgi:cob(I)alamin adenosyltransferase
MVEHKPKKKRKSKRIKKGLVIVYTGKGKGKTTAALGIAMRAWGRNYKVGIIQFIKPKTARTGEILAAEKMGIEVIKTGDGWTWTSNDMDETISRGLHGWEIAKERILNNKDDVIILDEFTYPLHYGWLDANEVIAWLKENKPKMLHLVITGRYAPDELIKFADLVTEMREIRHPYREQGIRAQIGVDF